MSRTALPCILKPHQASQASPERLNFYRTSPQAPQGSLRHPPSIHQTFPKPPNRPRVSLEHSRAFPKSLMPPSFPKAFTWTLFVRPFCFPWRLLVRLFFYLEIMMMVIMLALVMLFVPFFFFTWRPLVRPFFYLEAPCKVLFFTWRPLVRHIFYLEVPCQAPFFYLEALCKVFCLLGGSL